MWIDSLSCSEVANSTPSALPGKSGKEMYGNGHMISSILHMVMQLVWILLKQQSFANTVLISTFSPQLPPINAHSPFSKFHTPHTLRTKPKEMHSMEGDKDIRAPCDFMPQSFAPMVIMSPPRSPRKKAADRALRLLEFRSHGK
jgi:hypothetical protein